MTDILHITDRERTQAAVILALESARDEMASRIEALELQVSRVRMYLWDDFPACCGCPVVGAQYMGQKEMICCGNYEPSMLTDNAIVGHLRDELPPQPADKPIWDQLAEIGASDPKAWEKPCIQADFERGWKAGYKQGAWAAQKGKP